MVRIISRQGLLGVVTSSGTIGGEVRYDVFHDGVTRQYYASQLAPAEMSGAVPITARAFQVGLSAELVLDPATHYLHTLNIGRIDYEPYQYRPVLKMVQSDSPRLLVADDVGVGKTIEAALIFKELQAREEADSVLVICPRPLVVDDKWRSELRRFDEDFVHLDGATLRACLEECYREGVWPERYKKAIVPYSLLDERTLMGGRNGGARQVGLEDLAPGPHFDLVIVDEAHHVRNPATWSYRNVARLTNAARAVVMLSATPVQTASKDLFTLVNLLRDDLVADPSDFASMLEPNGHLYNAVESARAGRSAWKANVRDALGAALATPWGGEVMAFDPRVCAVRDLLDHGDDGDMVRVRVVRGLEDLNTFSDVISRTRRRDIGEFTTRKPFAVVGSFTHEQELVYRAVMDLARRIVERTAPGVPTQFLLSMLQRQAASSITALGPLVEDLLNNRLGEAESVEFGDAVEDLPQQRFVGGLAEEISRVGRQANALRDQPDPKAEQLRNIIEEKGGEQNSRVLVFSTFKHTLTYLLDRCGQWGARAAVIHGGVDDETRRDLRRRFRMSKQEPEAIDVMLCSEVGTEGLDYQFCNTLVNYDLPWNPMKIEQRIGRIDRRGQQSEAVAIYNLLTEGTVEKEIYDRCLLRIGVFHRSLGGSEEILGELTTRITTIADDLSLTKFEREAQLRQLADNELARIDEQNKLEESQADLLGLGGEISSRIDEATTVWLDETRIAHLVLDYLDRVQPGRKVALRPGRIATVRPSRDVADRIRRDLQAVGVPNQRLARILSRESPVLRLTTDPELVEGSDDVELLGPTHPLVRVAAQNARPDRATETSMRVASNLLPAGFYDIGVYGWTHVTRRERFTLRYVSTDPRCEAHAAELLANATAGELQRNSNAHKLLEERHHDAWSKERAKHVERTLTLLERQARNLTTRHDRRARRLESRASAVADANIQTMTRGQIVNEASALERQLDDLNRARMSVDLLSRHLGTVHLEVVAR
ncbi:helicase-related protein [Cellulosimicrobium protaetiae]